MITPEPGLDEDTAMAVAAIWAAGMPIASITVETAAEPAGPGTVGSCGACFKPARWLVNGRCDACGAVLGP